MSAGLPLTVGLQHDAGAPRHARRAAENALRQWEVDEEVISDALLVVTELVTNAVEHALPPVILELRAPSPGSGLSIEVIDGGPAPTEGAWAASGTPDEHGRGELIVSALTTRHGSRTVGAAAHHWATISVAR
ncbi:ATP-binding protein [Streptomyces heilongjiangensis]|uniref:ATP-binding protein n=1 Tax=Streptomyces heilongjiangensis TaxID=945052 RepID=A0ABW1BGY5_9ACTN|nr:ATP-binding protein [Streptomyces heilongjiangensis]MDC2950475.1 ATP-binding protein [Streptomyces heilongjiangensis]